jgi:hypothetical protein
MSSACFWFGRRCRNVLNATRQYARDSKGKHYAWNAEQVHDYVLFMANTGLRPDEVKKPSASRRDDREGPYDGRTHS